MLDEEIKIKIVLYISVKISYPMPKHWHDVQESHISFVVSPISLKSKTESVWKKVFRFQQYNVVFKKERIDGDEIFYIFFYQQ